MIILSPEQVDTLSSLNKPGTDSITLRNVTDLILQAVIYDTFGDYERIYIDKEGTWMKTEPQLGV